MVHCGFGCIFLFEFWFCLDILLGIDCWLIGSLVFLSGTHVLFCVGGLLTVSSHGLLWRLSFPSGPFYHAFFEESLKMAIQSGARWALFVVDWHVSKNLEFVHCFMWLFFFLVVINWLVEIGSLKVAHVLNFSIMSSGHSVTAGVICSSAVLVCIARV